VAGAAYPDRWAAIDRSTANLKGEMTMCIPSVIGRSLQLGILFLSSLVGSFAFAQVPVPELALTQTADDATLKWGSCPPFLPAGCALAVLHGDPAKNNLDVFFKVPGKSTIPLHWHTSAERMVLVAGEFHVTYEGQKTTILRPGTYAYGPAKRPHHGFCASADPCVLFIAFESPMDAVPIESAAKKLSSPVMPC
jgi:quercetin dioxygenase-like cupin family protein